MRKVLLVPMVLALSMSVLAADGVRTQAPATSQSPAGFPAAGGLPVVKLVSPGAEPRKALRYVVPSGHKARTEISTEMTMSMQMGGNSMGEMKMPAIKIVADLAVTSVAPNGDMSFTSGLSSMSFDTSGVDPMVATAMASVNTDVSAVKTTGTMTSRGMSNQQIDLTKITDPQLKTAMEQASSALQSISFPMPEEPVGVGARWEVRQRMNAGGIDTMTTQTVELVAIEGTKLTLKVTADQTAQPQAIKNPALPAEVETMLTKFSGTGTTTSVLDLATLSNQGEGTMTVLSEMSMKMGGMEQSVATTMGMKIKMTPVK